VKAHRKPVAYRAVQHFERTEMWCRVGTTARFQVGAWSNDISRLPLADSKKLTTTMPMSSCRAGFQTWSRSLG
jgi:hypothetical protein